MTTTHDSAQREAFDHQAMLDARIAYREAFSNGADTGHCIRVSIRKYLDSLGLDAKGQPYVSAPVADVGLVEAACNHEWNDAASGNEQCKTCYVHIKTVQPQFDGQAVLTANGWFQRKDGFWKHPSLRNIFDLPAALKSNKRIASALTSVAPKVDGWLPISTFDEENESIVLVTNGNGTWPAQYRYSNKNKLGFYERGGCITRINGVTHWQPLPKPPTTGT